MAIGQQHRIAQTLQGESYLRQLQEIIARGGWESRDALAREVCKTFGFIEGRGLYQTASCTTVLRRLEKQGVIEAVGSQKRGGWKRRPRGSGEGIAAALGVPEEAGQIQDLRLEKVQGDGERRQWNELLLREHPQGGQIITGRQLRYWIRSEHGIIGAIGVSAGALHLEARDRWIGWGWELRSQYLERVICLSRFLIRPGVSCRNLATRVLGQFCRQVGGDMEREYGFKPWLLETFVDRTRHDGACFRAGNWQLVGQSKGRGRNDVRGEAAVGVKDIYVYRLEADFRQQLGLPPEAGAVAMTIDQGLDGEGWVEQEMGDAPVGDRRLSQRLVSIAAAKSSDPSRPFSACVAGASAPMQGYYRFIEHADAEGVTMRSILHPHQECTIKRMREQRRVLCAQDSSDLDYTGLKSCVGLGQTGTNQRGAQFSGLRLHTTLALTAEGLPLGILSGECLKRTFRPGQNWNRRRHLPIEEKETYRWIKSVKVCEQIAAQLAHTQLVCVMDREGDFFEIFHHWAKTRRVHLLIRASRDRSGKGVGSLFTHMRQSPRQGQVEIHVQQRRNRQSQAVSAKVTLTVRFGPVQLPVPKGCRIPGAVPLAMWMVHAQEECPPPDTKPIEWFLISTEAVENLPKACQCLREYAFRWRIEDWHKVLKSGCAVEDIVADDTLSIERVVAINMVIAWRIQLMTLLGRKNPDLPPQTMFSDLELRVLKSFAVYSHLPPPDTLQPAVILVARLGGYRHRKSDPPPGNLVLWRGYTKLCAMCLGAALAMGIDSG